MSTCLVYSPSIQRRVPLIEGMTRDELITTYSKKVRLITNMVKAKVGSQVEYDDLLNSGMIGLLDAIEKYDPTHRTRFSTYAEFRIRGAILDSLRSLDLLTRTAREKATRLQKTLTRLQIDLRREPTQEEVARAMKLSLGEYHTLLDHVKTVTLFSMDETAGDDDGRAYSETLSAPDAKSAYDKLADNGLRQLMKKSMKSLQKRHQKVLLLYYYKELNFKEIGKVLSLSESRVCQLHTEAITRLRIRAQRALDV